MTCAYCPSHSIARTRILMTLQVAKLQDSYADLIKFDIAFTFCRALHSHFSVSLATRVSGNLTEVGYCVPVLMFT